MKPNTLSQQRRRQKLRDLGLSAEGEPYVRESMKVKYAPRAVRALPLLNPVEVRWREFRSGIELQILPTDLP